MSDDRESPTLADHMALLNEHLALLGERLEPVDRLMKDQFSWYVVAKKEFQDAIRSMGLWVLGLLFTTMFVIPPAAALYFGVNLSPQAQKFGLQVLIKFAYKEMATIFVPIITMFVGFGAITKERESGSLKVLLSLPHSRRDVILGKVFGRCAVVGVPLAVAFAVTALFLLIAGVTVNLDVYLLFSLYTVGLALVFVAIAVSISGAFSRSLYSLVANFVVYFYFTFGWNAIANAIADGVRDYLGVSGTMRWNTVLVLKMINPSQAYKTLVDSMLFEGANAARQARMDMFKTGGLLSQGRPWDEAEVCTEVLNGKATLVRSLFSQSINCQSAGASLPFYATDAAVAVYLLLWIGLAAFVSYRTFALADL
jgi:ABC-2 type transport system permease protein